MIASLIRNTRLMYWIPLINDYAENAVVHDNSERRILIALSRRAAELDLAIGQWWFGPQAGQYYVFDECAQTIVAGDAGFSLVELTAWFWRLDLQPAKAPKAISSRIAA